MDSKDEKTVFYIRKLYRDEKKSIEEIKNEFIDFSEKYPQLFTMICSDSCDDIILNKMISARRLVQAGQLSQHDASVKVGQDLVNKYVIPAVEKE